MGTKGRGRPKVDQGLIDAALELVRSGVDPNTVSDHLRVGRTTIYRRMRRVWNYAEARRKAWVTRRAAADQEQSSPSQK